LREYFLYSVHSQLSVEKGGLPDLKPKRERFLYECQNT
jgi:hypothetical protein